MDLNLTGKVVVVTGGASGIGRAIVEAFRAEGARVAVWDLEPSADDPDAIQVDVCNHGGISDAVQRCERMQGPIDCVVHAAATASGKFGVPFTNLTPADWPRVLDVNIMGMVNVAHGFAPRMMERKNGSMIFIASVAGQVGSPTDPPYSASKAANINFAICMARDLAPHGIRVNTVCPGMVKTPLNEAVWRAWHNQQPPESRKSYEEWTNEKLRAMVPLGRWQKAEDVANMVVFLSSDRASEVTGQTINVDGGYVMHW